MNSPEGSNDLQTGTSPPPFSMAQRPLEAHRILNIKVSRSHSGTPHSVGLLWTSDKPDAGTYT